MEQQHPKNGCRGALLASEWRFWNRFRERAFQIRCFEAKNTMPEANSGLSRPKSLLSSHFPAKEPQIQSDPAPGGEKEQGLREGGEEKSW
ncbi:hypothetical protein [uncultured Adlercreutzia sp.]|uniref:hypothetical protein n=1 Tax=uncultured Adlercreutzia sp. TaxID=875803 RepID=UPI0026F37F8B|nr:hypothetical protein [uncultured Adlercreutzia sp.]